MNKKVNIIELRKLLVLFALNLLDDTFHSEKTEHYVFEAQSYVKLIECDDARLLKLHSVVSKLKDNYNSIKTRVHENDYAICELLHFAIFEDCTCDDIDNKCDCNL